MEGALHIAGHEDDQILDLVIAEPNGRVVGLYSGANGEIAITAAEARFLLAALPVMIVRAEYLDYMGPLPALGPSDEAGATSQHIKIDREGGHEGKSVHNGEPARLTTTDPAQPKEHGAESPARPEPSPKPRGRGVHRHRPGRVRAGQPWSVSEDNALLSGYRGGQGIAALARIHGRSTKAIELRLTRLGIVLPEEREVA